PLSLLLSLHDALPIFIMDFSLDDVSNYLRGRDDALENIVYRRDGEIRAVRRARSRGGSFDLPVPRHELFQHPGYRFSFVRAAPRSEEHTSELQSLTNI